MPPTRPAPSTTMTTRCLSPHTRSTTLALASCLLVAGSAPAQSPTPTPTPHPLLLDSTTNTPTSNTPTSPVNLSSPNWTGTLAATQLPASIAAPTSLIVVDAALGSDTAGTGTAGSPVATLAKAVSLAQAGDTILLRPGSYTTDVVSVPAALSNLTILGQGAVITPTNTSGTVLAIFGDHFTGRDFEINGGYSGTGGTDMDNGAVEVFSSNAHLEHLYIHDGIGYGIRLVEGYDNVDVIDNRVERCVLGIKGDKYDSNDIVSINVLYNRILNNRQGGISMTNDSYAAYLMHPTQQAVIAFINERFIGNYIHNDTNMPGLGIELSGGNIVGTPKIPHQNPIIVGNTVQGYATGISINACAGTVEGENSIGNCSYIGIEYANSEHSVSTGDNIDCAGGCSGYSVSNNGSDALQEMDLHLSGSRVDNVSVGAEIAGVSVNSGNGIYVDHVWVRSAGAPWVYQFVADVTMENCTSIQTGPGDPNDPNHPAASSVDVEVGPGITGTTYHFYNNDFRHTDAADYHVGIFRFVVNNQSNPALGIFNDVILRNNTTDLTYCNAGFIQSDGNLTVNLTSIENQPQAPVHAGIAYGFVDTSLVQTAGNFLQQLTLPGGASNPNYITTGTGDGGTLATYDEGLHLQWGLGLLDINNVNRATYDSRAGIWDVSGGYQVKDQTVIDGSRNGTFGNVTVGGTGQINNLSVTTNGTFGNVTVGGTGQINNLSVTTASPPATLSVTPEGTSGSTTYSYQIFAYTAGGVPIGASAVASTSTGNAALSATNFNQFTWTASTPNAIYDVYRTVNGSGSNMTTTGRIATGTSNLYINDTGITADNTSVPTTANGTGKIVGGQSAMTPNTTGTIAFNNAGYSETIYNPSTTAISSGTITLPTTSAVGETVRYTGKATIGSITIAGGTVDIGSGLTSYPAGSVISWQSDTNGHWIRIQ